MARRVLIVDDNAAARSALTALLSTIRGIRVIGVADSAHSALEFVSQRPVDVVIMDVRMPGMSGLEATRRLKADHPEVAVVVLTVCSAFRDEAVEAGAERFVVKGGPVDELLAAVQATPALAASDLKPGRASAAARPRVGFASAHAVADRWRRPGHPD